MFKCKVYPYPIGSRRPDKVLPAALQFVKEWEAEARGERPFVIVKCFGHPVKLFISPAFRHIREGRHILEVARRFRLLPCVKELLMETTDMPVRTRDGNLMLEGKAPPNEHFRVILGEGPDGLVLVTFYPVQK